VRRASPPKFDKAAVLAALYKKFLWADALRRRYEMVFARDGEFPQGAPVEGNVGAFEEAFETDMHLCLWYSMLSVVVEAWPSAREKDETLQVLLRSKNTALLKDFRDATLHPTDWRDDRLYPLIAQGKDAYDWAVELTNAFRKFFEPIAELDRQSRRRTEHQDT
jgi:hypothetical protein